MRHFKKKNKIFTRGALRECFPGPAVALDVTPYIWDQCNIEDWPTDEWPIDVPFLKTPNGHILATDHPIDPLPVLCDPCIVAKPPYVVRYQQSTMLFVYLIGRDRKIAQILRYHAIMYNKTNITGVIVHYRKIFLSFQFVKYCRDLWPWAIFCELWGENFH